MKKYLVFLCLCIIFLGGGCNQDNDDKTGEESDNTNMENVLNEDVSNENVPTADIDTINKTNISISKNEIENNDLVATNVDILSSSELIITYTNKTENILTYGQNYILQVLKDDWVDVPALTNVGWKDVSMHLNAYESFESAIDLKQLFGELEKGHYRIIKEMFTDSTKINVTAEFDIL